MRPPNKRSEGEKPRSYGRQGKGKTIKSLSLPSDLVEELEDRAEKEGKNFSQLVAELLAKSSIVALGLDFARHYLCSGQGTTWETALAETGCDALAVAGWTCDKGGDLIAWAGPRIGDIMGSIIAAM